MKIKFEMDVAQVFRQHIYTLEGPAKFCHFCLNCKKASTLYTDEDYMCSGGHQGTGTIYPSCLVRRDLKIILWVKL